MQLPVWKFAALVEQWAWESFDEKNHAMLGRELQRKVDFTWMSGTKTAGEGVLADPLKWQQNTAGESLLSVHRNKAGE